MSDDHLPAILSHEMCRKMQNGACGLVAQSGRKYLNLSCIEPSQITTTTALYGAGCRDRCFVLEALSDTLSSDHEPDTVLLLFTSDDVLRLDSYGYDSCPRCKPRPDSAQIGFRFEYAGAV